MRHPRERKKSKVLRRRQKQRRRIIGERKRKDKGGHLKMNKIEALEINIETKVNWLVVFGGTTLRSSLNLKRTRI
jgi:hypothetical protein